MGQQESINPPSPMAADDDFSIFSTLNDIPTKEDDNSKIITVIGMMVLFKLFLPHKNIDIFDI
jgi:hypothetical protein